MPAHEATTSAMESRAPTSWKWTSSIDVWCTEASAFGQSLEDRTCALPHGWVETFEQGEDLGEVSHGAGLGDVDMHLGGAKATSLDVFDPQARSRGRTESRLAWSTVSGTPAPTRGAEHHVAAGACSPIEPCDRHWGAFINDSMRTAAHAAPKPLSMFTTVTPWAQLARALLSAVVPPVATP